MRTIIVLLLVVGNAYANIGLNGSIEAWDPIRLRLLASVLRVENLVVKLCQILS